MAKKTESNFLPISFILNQKKQVVPFSPSIDILTGGGLVEGTWNIFVGIPKGGKTSSILHFCKQAQKKENGGRKVFYANIEGRLSVRDLETADLDPELFFLISSTPEEKDADGNVTKPAKILTAEEYLTICEEALQDNPGCVLVIDSESMLVTNAEMIGGMDDMQRADGAKLMAKFARKVSNLISINNNIVLSVRHVSSNPTGYGAPIKEKGSFAGMYQCQMKMQIKSVEKWVVQEKQIGQIINWVLISGYLDNAIPNSTISSYLRYGQGIDELMEVVEMGINFGLIEKPEKGAWLTCHFLKEVGLNDKEIKFQGQDNCMKFFKENPKYQKILRDKIKELLV